MINNGTTTYYCSSSGGSETCVSTGATGSNPLGSLATLFSPATVLGVFQQAEAQAAAHAAGYNLTFSDATYAGQASKCVSASGAGRTFKYCVTNSGILAYGGSAGSSFELTNFSSSAPDSDFNLPAGATVETIPSIPSATG